MGKFDRQIATAKRLIQKNGQLVQWKRTVKDLSTTNPWEQVETEPILNDVYICFLPSTDPWIKYIKGTDVTAGALYGLMGQTSFDLSSGDVVIRDDKELRIKTIDKLSPNGQNILYTIEFV